VTTDPDRARAFYTQLFGWTAEDSNPEFGGYFNFRKDGVRVAGAMGSEPGAGPPTGWNVHLATDDAEKTLRAVTEHGGQALFGPHQVGDLGAMAAITDPGGAFVGVWQPGAHQGFGFVAETGAPAWFELHTRSYEPVVEFYRGVFGWDAHVMSDTDEFRYTTLGAGDNALAGIMDSAGFLPEGVPAYWAVYFAVDDADAAVAKVTELGGSVVEQAMDTPHGRIAHVSDPTGARFRIVAPNVDVPAS
jgi:predicted enzyme related to lactoylglutathione lyase